MKYLNFIELGCRILLIGPTFPRVHEAQILKFHILYFIFSLKFHQESVKVTIIKSWLLLLFIVYLLSVRHLRSVIWVMQQICIVNWTSILSWKKLRLWQYKRLVQGHSTNKLQNWIMSLNLCHFKVTSLSSNADCLHFFFKSFEIVTHELSRRKLHLRVVET